MLYYYINKQKGFGQSCSGALHLDTHMTNNGYKDSGALHLKIQQHQGVEPRNICSTSSHPNNLGSETRNIQQQE